MALHEILWPRLLNAVRGRKIVPNKSLDEVSGPVNYRGMGRGAALLGAWASNGGNAGFDTQQARARFLGFLQEQRRVGHLALEGPMGIANEQGCPDPHWKFEALPVVAVWREALRHRDTSMAAECAYWWASETYLSALFNFNGITLMPGGRVKDEKAQGLSEPRDVALAVAYGVAPPPPHRGAKWWNSDDGITASILAEILREHPELRPPLIDAAEPKLALPIKRVALPGGGYIAWIEDTDAARKQLGKDALSWVRNDADGHVLGYDWSELPELPSGAEITTHGE